MFWEKKDKETGLPDLPRPPASNQPTIREKPVFKDEFDDDDEDIHELPAFPDSPMHKGFSQSAIKEAVSNEDVKEEASPEVWKTETKTKYPIVEMDEWAPTRGQLKIQSPPQVMQRRDNKPIFVRIDKFQLARSSLETVKVKLSEIEELLKTIREVKAKEDAELSAWESEMENVKSRVQNVINDIFDKAES